MPGSHRGRPRRLRAFAPAAVASLIAVLIVVGAIVAVDVLHHHDSSSSGSTTVSTPASSPSSSSPTPTPSPTPTATPTSPKPTPTKPKPTKPAPVVTPAPKSTPVAVFNNSRVGHRGALAASRLRADGYPVTDIGTRRAYPGANVVYFPPGNVSLAAAARGVVARHIGIVAAEPRPASVAATSGLIVVVTSTYR